MTEREAGLEELRHFVEFVNLWCYRKCSATEEERLSVIKFHPTARNAAKAAGWVSDGELLDATSKVEKAAK